LPRLLRISIPSQKKWQLLARENQDNEKGKEVMEKRDLLVLDTHGIPFVTEAIEARVSQLQALPPSELRDSRLKFLNSFMEQLDQQLEQAQLEQALRVGMD
jgi:hypothetical protein